MGAVDAVEWACVLCGHHIQNDWANRATNLHQILHSAPTFLHGNYSHDSEGRSYGQLGIGSFIMTCARSCITSYAELFGETSNHSCNSPPYSSGLVPCDFWLFPKLKSPSKGNRFQTINEIQENMTGQLMATGRTVWGPKMTTLKGAEASLSYVQCFLYLLQQMSLYFILRGWMPSGQTLYIIFT